MLGSFVGKYFFIMRYVMLVEVCGVALDEVDLRRLSKPDVLNDKV